MPQLSRKWKVILFCCLFFAAFFAIFGGITFGYSFKTQVGLSLAGIIIGLISAPEIDPKAFKYPVFWQVVFSIFGSVGVAYSLSAPAFGYAIAVTIGFFMGWLAPYWLKHINIP